MFLRTPVHRLSSGDIIFALRREVVGPDPSDSVVEVTQTMENRLDNLAYELYGSAELWWVIAELNHIVDPMTEVVMGTQLRVPSKERLFNILST